MTRRCKVTCSVPLCVSRSLSPHGGALSLKYCSRRTRRWCWTRRLPATLRGSRSRSGLVFRAVRDEDENFTQGFLTSSSPEGDWFFTDCQQRPSHRPPEPLEKLPQREEDHTPQRCYLVNSSRLGSGDLQD
ncbi:hypothetical protein GN956_G13869 [Arapaima gigas]